MEKEFYRKSMELHQFLVEDTLKEMQKIKQDIQAGIQRHPRPNKDILDLHCQSLFNEQFKLLCAEYSYRGFSDKVEKCYYDVLDSMKKIEDTQIDYVKLLWLICFGILLEVPNDYMVMLAKIADQQYNDGLMDYFFNATEIGHEKQSASFYKPTPYCRLREVINVAQSDKIMAANELAKYVNYEWIIGHYDYGWKDAHKHMDFSGIWSFESAVIVKLFCLDESVFDGSKYYPHGLAYCKNQKHFSPENWPEVSLATTDGKGEKTDDFCNEERWESLIPPQKRPYIEQIIKYYQHNDKSQFYTLYGQAPVINEGWWTEEEFFLDENALEKIIVFFMVENRLLLQVDFSDDLDNYLLNFVNERLQTDCNIAPIGGGTYKLPDIKAELERIGYKLFSIDLDNDQQYIGILPANKKVTSIYNLRLKLL